MRLVMVRNRSAVAPVLWGAAAFLFAVPGCGRREAAEVAVASGVTFRRDARAGVQVLDVDLMAARAQPVVVAANVSREGNNFVGDCKTAREWAEQFGAVGGMNAGFFGETYDDLGRRKQIVGLAMAAGKVVAPGGAVVSTRTPGERFLRAAFGVSVRGTPDVAWASGARSGFVRRYDDVVNPGPGTPWAVTSAVACGPRLFVRGRRRITDREERLVHPERVPRAFVAYDVGPNGRPRRLLLGRADAMDFSQVADWLEGYFSSRHGSRPHDALCLDGGPSAQLVYRDGNTLRDAEPTGVLVPTAILLVPR